MTKIICVIMLLFSIPVYSANLCKEVTSKGEGHWPTPEQAFTKTAAAESAEKIKQLIKSLDDEDYYVELENAYMYIRGYALRTYAQNAMKEKSKFAQNHLDTWCDFIKNDAYFRH